MNCSYQRIICLLLLTAMVFIGSCQALQESDVTNTRINLKEGLRDALRILVSVTHLYYHFEPKIVINYNEIFNLSFISPQRLSTKIPNTNYRTTESILKRLFDYDALVEHLNGLPDSNGSGAEETKSKTPIFETLLEDACKWVSGILYNYTINLYSYISQLLCYYYPVGKNKTY